MAQKSLKSRAQRNISSLTTLHSTTLALHLIFLAYSFNFLPFSSPRSLLAYIILSTPSFVAEYVLERSGRPLFVNGVMKSPGEDLAASGLTEYLFDVVWVTWACLAAVLLFGNWAWLLWAVIPVYGAVKGYSLLGVARGMMGGGPMGQGITDGQEDPSIAGNRKQRRKMAA